MVLLALSRLVRRRRARRLEARLMAEAAPRVADRLASLAGAAPSAATVAPPTAVAVPMPDMPASMAAFAHAAVDRARVTAPHDPRWRMWRDASAALVAFALVGVVLAGGDLLGLPSGPTPSGPAVAAATATPARPTSGVPTPQLVALGPDDSLPVLTTASPAPVTATPTAAPTPPLTGDAPAGHAAAPTPRRTKAPPPPTPRPTPAPTATPALDATFYCQPATYRALVDQQITCHAPAADAGATYEWRVGLSPDLHVVPDQTSATLTCTFQEPGYYTIELTVTRAGASASTKQAFDIDPPASSTP